jgi:hypothetical protein
VSVAVTVLAGVGFVLSAVFVAVYSRRRWWRSHTGRILMTLVAVLGLLFALRVFDRTGVMVPEWAWALGYLVLDAGLAGLLWLLLRDVEDIEGD